MALSKENRLIFSGGIQEVLKNGKTLNSEFFKIKYLSDSSGSKKFSFSVPSRIFKKAVQRNFVRRQLKEIVRKNLSQIRPGRNTVVIVKKNILAEGRGKIEKALIAELDKTQ